MHSITPHELPARESLRGAIPSRTRCAPALAAALLALLSLTPVGLAGNESAKLAASDGAADDFFGSGVSISGGRALIGSPFDDDGATNTGSAYLAEWSGASWAEVAKLTASDAAGQDSFGTAVAVDGDLAIVSAPNKFVPPVSFFAGAVYAFERQGTAWVETAKITATGVAGLDVFGTSLALDGVWLVVGAPGDDDGGSSAGAAYVFRNQSGTWVQKAKLTALDAAAGDGFGVAVAIAGTRVVVGADGDDDAGADSGSAYVFEKDGASWPQVAKLTALDAAAADRFGAAVAMDGERALVGAPRNTGSGAGSGAAYVFDRAGGAWPHSARLVASEGDADDRFGWSVALAGPRAVIGAPGDQVSGGAGAGSAYVFEPGVTGWVELEKLIASDASASDSFGDVVSATPGWALVGTPLDDLAGTDVGSAYVFDLPSEPGTPTCFGTGCPCGNDDPAAGCATSTGTGAHLAAAGTASAGADDLLLVATGVPPGNNGLFYMGDALVLAPFFDGLQCALGTTFRFLGSIQGSGTSGTMTYSGVGAASGLVVAGSTWHFHAWFRDFPGSPCGTGANLSNAYTVTFAP